MKKLLLLPCLFALSSAPAADSGLLEALDTETTRAFKAFSDKNPPLYFLACGVTETESLSVGASFGALTMDHYNRSRFLDIDARCGSYQRDNTHPLPGHMVDHSFIQADLPLEDNVLALRMALWNAIEPQVRSASERFAQVKALDITKAALRDKSDDFSKAPSEKMTQAPLAIAVDREAWKEKVKRYTLPLVKHPDIYRGSGSLTAMARTRTFVNSEGSRLQFTRVGYQLMIRVSTRSEDGLDLPLYESAFAWNAKDLPPDGEIMAKVAALAETAVKLRKAPLVDPYSGPAILEGKAAAVFMHEVMGHRLEGHRQKDEKESQTFRGMMDKKVLPEFLSVTFDPTIDRYRGLPMSGFYPFDEEGVRAQKCVCVDKGILRRFLMSRTPIEAIQSSNGHGRAMAGRKAVSRQSNLIVEASQTRPAAELRTVLIEECKKQNKPYGLVFKDVEGGFTMTGRYVPNAFNVSPLVVVRVYTDGRPDELVRGVDIIGTPLTALTKIIAAGDDVSVFNGVCGAESGGVPVGAASPSLLLGEIEVQEKEISRARPPILPPPDADSKKEVRHE